MNKLKTSMVAGAAILAALSSATSTFAAEPYGIKYSGGTTLGASNVTINQKLVDGLVPLLQNKRATVTTSSSTKWKTGYILDNFGDGRGKVCTPFKYFTVDGTNISASDKLSVNLSNDKYSVDVAFNNVLTEGTIDTSSPYTVGLAEGYSYIYGGWDVYSKKISDSECGGDVINALTLSKNAKLFVEMNLKLHKKGSTSIYNSDGIYFGLTDIDAAQSYKILNSTNTLSKNNMYAASADKIQGDGTYNNMFVSNGGYIYSQYNNDGASNYSGGNDVFVKLDTKTQQEGLNIVFGFVERAASGVEYYDTQYKVTYVSDEYGKITGKTKEDVLSNENPTGSTQKPNEGYEFTHWTADVDVTLKDGKVIKAGEKITEAQIKQVVVTQDIEFKAYHSPEQKPKEPAAPNTGASTEELNATQIVVSVLGIGLGALMIGLLPYLNRKKIGFNKQG